MHVSFSGAGSKDVTDYHLQNTFTLVTSFVLEITREVGFIVVSVRDRRIQEVLSPPPQMSMFNP